MEGPLRAFLTSPPPLLFVLGHARRKTPDFFLTDFQQDIASLRAAGKKVGAAIRQRGAAKGASLTIHRPEFNSFLPGLTNCIYCFMITHWKTNNHKNARLVPGNRVRVIEFHFYQRGFDVII